MIAGENSHIRSDADEVVVDCFEIERGYLSLCGGKNVSQILHRAFEVERVEFLQPICDAGDEFVHFCAHGGDCRVRWLDVWEIGEPRGVRNDVELDVKLSRKEALLFHLCAEAARDRLFDAGFGDEVDAGTRCGSNVPEIFFRKLHDYRNDLAISLGVDEHLDRGDTADADTAEPHF